jgi:hypothetical protein
VAAFLAEWTNLDPTERAWAVALMDVRDVDPFVAVATPVSQAGLLRGNCVIGGDRTLDETIDVARESLENDDE